VLKAHVYCLSKGKEHKKYEFGAKASALAGKKGGVILGAYSPPKNDDDGHSLGEALASSLPFEILIRDGCTNSVSVTRSTSMK